MEAGSSMSNRRLERSDQPTSGATERPPSGGHFLCALQGWRFRYWQICRERIPVSGSAEGGQL
jgi:hypothetical protein